jgi:PEP-CTERM motif
MRLLRSALVVMVLGLFSVKAEAAPVLIDFESLADFDAVTNQFAADGILFTGATALLTGSVGGSLNEFDFPPASGNAVVFNSDTDLRIDFATGASSVSALFTYLDNVTLTAFNGATVLGSVAGSFAGGNLGSNELLDFAFAGVITHVILSSSNGAGSFVLDDLRFNTIDDTAPVPEPATATLFLIGAGAALVARRRRARQHA